MVFDGIQLHYRTWSESSSLSSATSHENLSFLVKCWVFSFIAVDVARDCDGVCFSVLSDVVGPVAIDWLLLLSDSVTVAM